jgi:hypothetical protein
MNYALHFSLWQLNSLTEPAYSRLYGKLQSEWFDSLGISSYPSGKFYDQHKYRMFQKIYGSDRGKNRPGFLTGWADGNVYQRAVKGIYDNGIRYTAEYLVLSFLNRRYLHQKV